MPYKPSKWITSLREEIRLECGEGWMVRGIGKGLVQKVKLTVRFEDGKRTSIVLGPSGVSWGHHWQLDYIGHLSW